MSENDKLLDSVLSQNDISDSSIQLDSVVKSVINKFVTRAKFGQMKYGTNLDRTDLNTKDWIQHAQEELMDGILYLEKLKQQLSSEN